MSPARIVYIVGIVLVVATGLIPLIPASDILLALVGLAVGYFVTADDRANLFLTVIVLFSGAALAFDEIPVIGPYVSEILEDLTALLAAAAVAVIVMAIKDKLLSE